MRGAFIALACLPGLVGAAPKPFSLRAGDAASTLKEFVRQSGEQVVFLTDNVRGVRTRRLSGTYEPAEALAAMLAGTKLTFVRDERTGALAVTRRADAQEPAGASAAGSASPPALPRKPGPAPIADEIVVLSTFTVSAEAADRYRAADAISAVRVRSQLLDTASSVTVLTRDVIDDLAPSRLFDVTRYVAGIEEGRGIQFSDRQILRGFENNGRTVDNFLQTGADNFDEAVVERLEIAKGPNAILSPAGAPGGSINVITKSPRFSSARSVTAQLGLFDAQKLTADLTGPVAPDSALAYRLVAAFQDTRRYWAGDARMRGKLFAPMLTWRLSPRTELTVKLIAAEHWIFREPGLIIDPGTSDESGKPRLAPGFSAKGRNGIQPWSHVGTHTADAFVVLTSELNEHLSTRFAANGRYYFEDSKQEFFSTPLLADRYNPWTGSFTQDTVWTADGQGGFTGTHSPLFDPTSIPVRGDDQATRNKTVTVQADLAARFQFAGIASQTVAGCAVSRQTNVGRSWSGAMPPIDLTRPELRADPVWSSTFNYINRTSFTNRQIYLNQRFGLWGDRVQLSGGVMYYDTYTRSSDDLTPEVAPGVLDDAKGMRQASLLLKPRRNVSVYYSYSTNSTPTISNNLPLWRDGQQHEVGFKSEFFHQRLSFSSAVFRITQTNVSVPNPEHQSDRDTPEQLISDLGDHGVEFELAGGLTPNLSILAAYTHLKLRDSLGRTVRAVADRNAGILLNYRFHEGPLARLSLSAGVSYAGKRAGDSPAVNFTPLGVVTRHSFVIPAYTVTNLGAAYRWRNYLFRLNVDNLLDDKGYVQQAGGRVSGTGLSTAPGRNVKFTTTVEF